MICSERDCERPAHAKGLCDTHYRRVLRSATVCEVPTCGEPRAADSLRCEKHRDALANALEDKAVAEASEPTKKPKPKPKEEPGFRWPFTEGKRRVEKTETRQQQQSRPAETQPPPKVVGARIENGTLIVTVERTLPLSVLETLL